MDDEWTTCIFRQKNIWLVWKYKHQKYNDMGVRRKKGKSPMASDIYTNINTFIYLLFFLFSFEWVVWFELGCNNEHLPTGLEALSSSIYSFIVSSRLTICALHRQKRFKNWCSLVWFSTKWEKKKKKKIYIHKCVHMCMTKEWTSDIDFPSWSPLGLCSKVTTKWKIYPLNQGHAKWMVGENGRRIHFFCPLIDSYHHHPIMFDFLGSAK